MPQLSEPEQVDQEPRHTDPGDHQGALDLMGLAQRSEEHGVDQSPHYLRPDPAEGVLVGRTGFLGESHGDQRHYQCDPADHHLHNEKPKSHGPSSFQGRGSPHLGQ
uniref:Uncharacterized protein n=1 Tax=Seriola lalandi dorsalis TaxID=1841481 RepID=A0A3B4WC64_SERLL